MKKHFVLFCIISSALSSCAQSLPEKIDTLLTAFEKQEAFSGSVLVAREGTVIFEKGYGFKNKKENTRNNSNTIFQIGSITKQFTSAIILQLAEKNQLSLQDKLSKYIPDYPDGDQITIEHLLTHTSGVYNYTNDGAFMKNSAYTPIRRDSLIALFKNKPLDFQPGDKFNYSNSGYILLGYIIEKVTGKPYFQVVRERIFGPLHMDHSGFDFTDLVSPDKAVGYTPGADAELPAPIVDSSVSFAAGAIYTTPGDLYKWDRSLYAGSIITPASQQKAFTSHLAKYGYGWSIDSAYGKKVVEHGGGITGFVSFILRVPEDQTCVIIFDNHPSRAQPGQIAAEINALLNGQAYSIPHARTAIHVDTAILRLYVGEYQLSPGFILTMTLENGSLISQATGQGKVELFAEKENFFFLKVADIQIEFIKGPDNKVEKLILHQNGRLVTGTKINRE
jgi:CubicO group peptidase (beta-lactamase class C family)